METLSADLGVQYLNLLDASLRSRVSGGRGVSFVSKVSRGSKHWYLQLTVGSRKTQHYIGPDSDAVNRRMDAERARWKEAAPELAARERRVAALVAGGAPTVTTAEARLFEVLEQAGVFLAGGVLVGSHAFRCYSNMLGVRWSEGADRTMDIDVADTIAIGAPVREDVPLRTRLLESGLGLLEVPALDRKHPSTQFKIRGQQLSVQLLTPLHGKPGTKPVLLPNLNAYATPIRWLDYLLEDPQPAVIVARSGILVNVPAPGRYALHKLMVASRRPPYFATKARKDAAQAVQLLEALIELRPGDLHLAWDALAPRRDGLRATVLSGARRIPSPLRERLSRVLPTLGGPD